MRRFLVIAQLTLHEAARRRILLAALLCAAAFLALFAAGFHAIERDMVRHGTTLLQRRFFLTFITLAGLYAANFLAAMTAVLLPLDTLSGEIVSGVMQTVAAKPVRRSEIVIGKWLAYGAISAGYLLLVAGGVLLAARLLGGLVLRDVHVALPLMLLEGVLLVTLSIAGGTRFATVTNGIVVLGLYGMAFIGGWVEQVGALLGNDTARYIGTAASLVMPSESLWQLASYHMQPSLMRDLPLTPFSPSSVPSPAMVVWAAGYVVVALAAGLHHFRRRPL